MESTLSPKDFFFIVAFTLILFTGVIGNSLVIYIFKYKNPLTLGPMELIITYLALSDLIASIFNPLLYIYWHATDFGQWDFGNFCCVLFPSIITVSVTVSLGLILLITIERCKVLTNPFGGMFSKKHVHCMVALVFVLSVLNELPYIQHQSVLHHAELTYECKYHHTNSSLVMYFKNTTYLSGECDQIDLALAALENKIVSNTTTKSPGKKDIECQIPSCSQIRMCAPKNTNVYLYSRVATLILRDVVFILTFIVSNCLIYKALNDNEHKKFLNDKSGKLDPKKTLNMLLTMAIVFSILVLPKDIFTIVYTLSHITGSGIDNVIGLEINSGLKLLQSCNSIANIFIYAKLHASFKECMKDTIFNISISMQRKSNSKQVKV